MYLQFNFSSPFCIDIQIEKYILAAYLLSVSTYCFNIPQDDAIISTYVPISLFCLNWPFYSFLKTTSLNNCMKLIIKTYFSIKTFTADQTFLLIYSIIHSCKFSHSSFVQSNEFWLIKHLPSSLIIFCHKIAPSNFQNDQIPWTIMWHFDVKSSFKFNMWKNNNKNNLLIQVFQGCLCLLLMVCVSWLAIFL